MTTAERLDALVRAACPAITGVSLSTPPRIDFTPEATPQQRTAAQAVVDGFDWSDAAQTAWEEDRKPERKALRAAAAQAVADLDTFLAIPTPTAAQVRDAVQLLCRIQKRVIARLIQLD